MAAATPATLPPDIDTLLLLESPLARMPYEDLRRRMRVHQRITETTFTGLTAATKDMQSCSSKEEMLGKLDTIIERVKAMRQRVRSKGLGYKTTKRSPLHPANERPAQLDPLTGHLSSSLSMLQDRTKHLSEVHEAVADATADPTSASALHRYQSYSDTRLERMLTDWLLRRGHVSSASSLVSSRSLDALTDVPLFKELAEIRASLIPPSGGGQEPKQQQPSCASALAWCTENKAALRRFKSTLEFDLRVQEFIDLCRLREPDALSTAITYARKHLLPPYKAALAAGGGGDGGGDTEATPKEGAADATDEEDQLNNARIIATVSQVLGLLAVAPGGWAYSDLYSSTRYAQLYESLLAAALRVYSLPPQPLLHIALSAGLASLKVPACFGGERSGAQGVANEAAPPSAELTPAAGPVNEELMRDVQREVEAEAVKHSADLDDGAGGEEETLRNNDCPVCATVNCSSSSSSRRSGAATTTTTGLGVLAKEVPWSHHSNSTIVCRVTGKVIDDSDEYEGGMVALPNGRVYSRRALEVGFMGMISEEDRRAADEEGAAEASSSQQSTTSLASSPWSSKRDRAQVIAEGGEFVTCPRTKKRFPRSGMRKVYIT